LTNLVRLEGRDLVGVECLHLLRTELLERIGRNLPNLAGLELLELSRLQSR
jgi:hypothetical protein